MPPLAPDPDETSSPPSPAPPVEPPAPDPGPAASALDSPGVGSPVAEQARLPNEANEASTANRQGCAIAGVRAWHRACHRLGGARAGGSADYVSALVQIVRTPSG